MICAHLVLIASRDAQGNIAYHCKRCGAELERPETTYRDDDTQAPKDFRFALAKQALVAQEEAEARRPVTSAEGTTEDMFIGYIMKSMERFFIGLDPDAMREIAQDMLKSFLEFEKIKFADPSQTWDSALADVIVDEMKEYYCEGTSN